MLPSRRLILLVAGAAPLLVAAAVWGPLLVAALAYLALVALYATADALLLPRRNAVALDRRVPARVSIGVPTLVGWEVENRSGRPLEVRLAEDLPRSLDADPPQCAARFDPRARGRLEFRLTAHERGAFALEAVDVRLRPPGGLFFRQFRLKRPAEVHVFPNLVNLRRYELLIRRGLLHEQGVARMRRIGQGTQFESLRPYLHGDGMSRVDWKATAKRGTLIVRNYEPEREQSVLVALDVGRACAGEFEGLARLDWFVNAALMLAYAALRQGDWFSLLAFSDRIETYLPPVRGLKNVERVAQALYRLKPRLLESDYGSACRWLGLKNRKRSLICLMTDVIDRDSSAVIIGYLARFARTHLPLAVTLSDPEVKAVAEAPLERSSNLYAKAAALDVLSAREEALAAMRQHGVGVLDVPPRALTPELINRYLLIKATRRL